MDPGPRHTRYMAAHVGEGADLQRQGVFGTWTQTKSDSCLAREQPFCGYWAAKEICAAVTNWVPP